MNNVANTNCVLPRIFDQRCQELIKKKDKLWRCNTSSTLQKVNSICSEPSLDLEEKMGHRLHWIGGGETIPTSFDINIGTDSMVVEYRNPEKKLVPGIMDSPRVSGRHGYEKGVHLFQFDLKCVSDMTYRSHLNVYIGLEAIQTLPNDGVNRYMVCKWWLSLTKFMLMKSNSQNPRIPPIDQYPPYPMEMPSQVWMVLDMDEGSVGFVVNKGEYLGPCYSGLCGLKVHPTVSYYGNEDYDVSMEYIGAFNAPSSLKKICKNTLHNLAAEHDLSKEYIESLEIPQSLKQYVKNNLS